MKPKTKNEIEVTAIGNTLPDLNDRQKEWAGVNSIDNRIYFTKSGNCWCTHCGTAFSQKGIRAGEGIRCPHCGHVFKAQESRCTTFSEIGYSAFLTTREGWQVVRYFLTEIITSKGAVRDRPHFSIEVLRLWMKPGQATIKQGVRLGSFPMYRRVPYCTDTRELSIVRSRHDAYSWGTDYRSEWFKCVTYPWASILPEYKRYGITHNAHGIGHDEMFEKVPKNPKMETYLKIGQYDLLRDAIYNPTRFNGYEKTIKIALRHGYDFNKVTLPDYADYLRQLEELGMDLHNPVYICPENLTEAHARTTERIRRIRRMQESEKQRKQREKDTKLVERKMSGFVGFGFTDGKLTVRPLTTLQEFEDEANHMHHCVYANRYFAHDDTLILSARIGDKRIETIEVNTKSFKIVQSRGVCNTMTPQHEDIINLVSSNMGLIRKQVRAVNFS